jgi:hypothetical protein
MRPLADRLKDVQDVITRLDKSCKKCMKHAPSCSGSICNTYRDIKSLERERENLYREQGGVK